MGLEMEMPQMQMASMQEATVEHSAKRRPRAKKKRKPGQMPVHFQKLAGKGKKEKLSLIQHWTLVQVRSYLILSLT